MVRWNGILARRRLAPAALLACALAGSVPARAQTVDDWFGADKALHFSLSALLAGGGYAGAALVTDRTSVRVAAGAGFSLTLGIGKELFDAVAGGDPSWRDFTWDVIGTGVGVLSAWLVDSLVRSFQRRPVAR
jgi:putative lipoprotein